MYTESPATLDPITDTVCQDLSGDWNGKWTCDPRFYGPDASELDGAFTVRLQFTPDSDDATFSGLGTDHIGAFLVTGHLDVTRKRVSFKKEYTIVQSGYHKPAWRYRGDLDIDLLSHGTIPYEPRSPSNDTTALQTRIRHLQPESRVGPNMLVQPALLPSSCPPHPQVLVLDMKLIPAHTRSLVLSGEWNGKWTCDPRLYGPNASDFDGAFTMRLQSSAPSEDEDFATFSGRGTDSVGAFLITGQLAGTRLSFKKQYTTMQSGYQKPVWRYSGDLDVDLKHVSGDWGGLEDNETYSLGGGTFYMERATIASTD
ncbi:hypothetical protein EXIGLDRAFT_691802 [Exidia glandulosa HHB12029]|uniref:Uncharacterized protein n=1 Tax=Exidia glandulosa HHB12029 TaxID=1314781 RepID=A0A165IGX5_EXIGL|nr:hypothetical protein EXIGLDRAFT_691802 [Exidia glandulosa HHB12029]